MVQNIYNNWLASFSLNNQWKSCLKVYNENFNDNYDSWFFVLYQYMSFKEMKIL